MIGLYCFLTMSRCKQTKRSCLLAMELPMMSSYVDERQVLTSSKTKCIPVFMCIYAMAERLIVLMSASCSMYQQCVLRHCKWCICCQRSLPTSTNRLLASEQYCAKVESRLLDHACTAEHTWCPAASMKLDCLLLCKDSKT